MFSVLFVIFFWPAYDLKSNLALHEEFRFVAEGCIQTDQCTVYRQEAEAFCNKHEQCGGFVCGKGKTKTNKKKNQRKHSRLKDHRKHILVWAREALYFNVFLFLLCPVFSFVLSVNIRWFIVSNSSLST